MVTRENKYHGCYREEKEVNCKGERKELARLSTVVTVWHEGAGCRLSRSFTCHTPRIRRRTSLNVAGDTGMYGDT